MPKLLLMNAHDVNLNNGNYIFYNMFRLLENGFIKYDDRDNFNTPKVYCYLVYKFCLKIFSARIKKVYLTYSSRSKVCRETRQR